MDFMLCLGHFCELHGPTSILVTQALFPKQATEEVPSSLPSAAGTDASLCASCRLAFPTLPQTPTGPVTSMRTVKNEPQLSTVVYLTTQFPADSERYAMIRQSCLKILSSEHTFNDSTPIVISDPRQGTALGLVFKVPDDMSRGHLRQYALICHCDNEQLLMSSWQLIKTHLNMMKTSIQQRAAKEYEKDESSRRSSSGGIDLHLRTRRESKQHPPRSLTSILKNDQLYGEIHSQFSYLLSLLNRNYRFSKSFPQ